jgi:hypothetical protein
MSMTSHGEPLETEAHTTWEEGLRGNYAFLQERESLCGLECGTGRILTHYCTIQQRLVRIAGKKIIVGAALTSYHHSGIVGGAADHTEYLTRGGFYGHYASLLACHETLSESLQFHIDGQGEILARNGRFVELAILITSLDTSAGIAKEDFNSLFATQLFLVLTLYAKFSDIVTAPVIVVAFNILGAYLANVSKNVCCIRIGILAYASLLYVETRIAEKFFAEGTELLGRQLAHEQLLGITAVTGIAPGVADFIHTAFVPLGSDTMGVAQIQGIYANLLLHHNHYVISRLVVHQQFAIAVGYGTTGREKDMLQKSVAIGILFEILA